MNTCSYCGAKYPDEAGVCPVDHTRMVEESAAHKIVADPQMTICKPPIAFRARLSLCLGPWIAVVVLVIVGLKDSLMVVGIFPLTTPFGALVMQAFFMTRHESLGSRLAIGIGWLYYAALTFLVFRSRRRWIFYSLYTFLCGSLLFSTGAYVIMRYFYKQ